MARTKKNPVHRPVTSPTVTRNGADDEVLTLAEAADYLRLSEREVVDLVHSQNLPGRFTGKEWRFLKAALMGWLLIPAREAGKQIFLSIAGSWKDDPDIDEIVRESHKRRGRSVRENLE
jgi:excisionase family DNA binding protein